MQNLVLKANEVNEAMKHVLSDGVQRKQAWKANQRKVSWRARAREPPVFVFLLLSFASLYFTLFAACEQLVFLASFLRVSTRVLYFGGGFTFFHEGFGIRFAAGTKITAISKVFMLLRTSLTLQFSSDYSRQLFIFSVIIFHVLIDFFIVVDFFCVLDFIIAQFIIL